eukprot:NODE_160_length_16633_cov_0.230132.p8 type:complete len:234 gc:universal NODE_160_length_16633_cov_0.230132:5011-5712(+)
MSLHTKPFLLKAVLRDFVSNAPKKILELPSQIYGLPARRDILWSCMVWQRDLQRQGTSSTKGRGEVKGSTRKMRPQKKTGKARAGNKRAPHWRTGGIVHGPKPRIHATRLPLKVRELGLKVLMSQKLKNDELVFVDEFSKLNASKLTESLSLHYPPLHKDAVFSALKTEGNYASTLFLTGVESGKAAELQKINIPNVKVLHTSSVNILDMLDHHYLVMDSLARELLTKRLLRE